MGVSKEIKNKQKAERLGEEKINHQGCLMKIIKYNKSVDIIVEFQDKYKTKVHTQYGSFKRGDVGNPYYPSVFNVGIVGSKYKTKNSKEYNAWHNMMQRCFDNKFKEKCKPYKDVTCCDEWLLYENFYEWLHRQDNFNKWLNGTKWEIDKDIIIKGNKIYSSEACCLVPRNVNTLFVKCNATRGNFPIGVTLTDDGFLARCMNPMTGVKERIGKYSTSIYAFLAYKKRKEEIIKQIAEIEYNKGNITKECYNAMMKYEVEITD